MSAPTLAGALRATPESSRLSIREIAERLAVGRICVYRMLESRQIPGIRAGKRWIVTRHAFEQWERTCGMSGTRSASCQ